MEQRRKVRLKFRPRRKAPVAGHGEGVYECLLDESGIPQEKWIGS
jgi:hypothetical protein